MNSLLMMAYLFPPIGGGGVPRTVKFAKYLPEWGWTPVILTVKERSHNRGWWKVRDDSLLLDLPPDSKIHRARSLDILEAGWPSRLFHVGARLLFIPDDQTITWLPFALRSGLKIVARNKIDAIYSTSIPYANHFLGLLLKRLTGKPWVADFRDPWTTNPNYGRISAIHARVERFYETHIYRSADAIITSTKGYRRDLLEAFPEVNPDKVVSITNGYDLDDFATEDPSSVPTGISQEKFNITYLAGSSYGDYFLDPFLKGLRMFFDQNPDLVPFVSANLVGEDPKGLKLLESLEMPNGAVRFHPFVPQQELNNVFRESSVLLLLLPDEKWRHCIPQKAFLYMRAGKPILALAPEGECSKLVDETGTGVAVSPENVQGVASAIYDLYIRFRSQAGSHRPNAEAIGLYDRRNTARQLADVLNRALAGDHRGTCAEVLA